MRFSSFECFLRHDKLRHKYTLLGFSRMRKNDCVLQKCVFFLPQAFCGNNNNNKTYTQQLNEVFHDVSWITLANCVYFISLWLHFSHPNTTCIFLRFSLLLVRVYFYFHILDNHKRKKIGKKGRQKIRYDMGAQISFKCCCSALHKLFHFERSCTNIFGMSECVSLFFTIPLFCS